MTQRAFPPFEVIDPDVAAEVKAVAAERVNQPFTPEHAIARRSPRTQALLDGATVFIPGTKSTRNWSGWYRKVFEPKGLRCRQFWAEYQGATGHFVWATPLDEGRSK